MSWYVIRLGVAGVDGMALVDCAFCHGSGASPSGTCQVCGGAGMRRLKAPVARCAFCKGSGVSPGGSRLTCTSCGGVGQVAISDGAVACPDCAGGGRAKDGVWSGSPLPCGRCRGKGVVAPKRA